VPTAIQWLQQYLPFSVMDKEALSQLVQVWYWLYTGNNCNSCPVPADFPRWLNGFLASMPVALAGLTLTLLALFHAQLMTERQAEAGELLQGVGEQPAFMFVVRQGSVRITNAGAPGGAHSKWKPQQQRLPWRWCRHMACAGYASLVSRPHRWQTCHNRMMQPVFSIVLALSMLAC
jgi:hypothetical protein